MSADAAAGEGDRCVSATSGALPLAQVLKQRRRYLAPLVCATLVTSEQSLPPRGAAGRLRLRGSSPEL